MCSENVWVVTYRYATHDPHYHGERTTTVVAHTREQAIGVVREEHLATLIIRAHERKITCPNEPS
jgi:hypothetical protein